MAKRPGVLTGTAGVYFVAYELACRGFHAAVTPGNAPAIDILVAKLDGSASLSLQVKTTESALRTRGRGDSKSPHHYEWDVGERAANLNHPNLFFAFVDLRPRPQTKPERKPDVFIVPSKVICETFDRMWDYFHSGKPRRWRWHPLVKDADPFKNNWDLLSSFLDKKATPA